MEILNLKAHTPCRQNPYANKGDILARAREKTERKYELLQHNSTRGSGRVTL